MPSSHAQPIDTVVFDVGMVLLEWDPRYLYRKIFVGDEAKMEWFLAEVCPNSWNVEQDRGRPWEEALAEAIGRHPTYAAEIRAYRERWSEMVPGAIEDTVTILEALAAANVPLYAITNFASDTFAEALARFDFFKRFQGIVVSGDEKVLKPDPRIFHTLAERHGVDLTRSIFIDDSVKNVVGAEAVGMAAHHFTSPAGLAADLRARGFQV